MYIPALVSGSDGTLYAGTGNELHRSEDKGATWTRVAKEQGTWITELAVNAEGQVFIGTNGKGLDRPNGVFRSVDSGVTWELVLILKAPVQALTTTVGGQVFAATPEGVYASSDKGLTWRMESSGLTNPNVLTLSMDVAGHLLAGTHGSGLYRSQQSVRLDLEPQEVPSLSFEGAIYPNPLTKEATLKLTLERPAERTSVKIYDLLGRETASFLFGPLPVGEHEFHLEADGLPSGIYYCRIELDNQFTTVPFSRSH